MTELSFAAFNELPTTGLFSLEGAALKPASSVEESAGTFSPITRAACPCDSGGVVSPTSPPARGGVSASISFARMLLLRPAKTRAAAFAMCSIEGVSGLHLHIGANRWTISALPKSQISTGERA